MIDDLVTLGTEEPYRMFTSRAEYRLLLGCDSVYERLSPVAERLGIIDEPRLERARSRIERMTETRNLLTTSDLNPDRETLDWLEPLGISFAAPATAAKLASRPEFDLARFGAHCSQGSRFDALAAALHALSEEELEGISNQMRYAGYIERQAREALRMRGDDDLRIPADFSYLRPGLSAEMTEKLSRVRPVSLGQAARIPGVTPAAISIIRVCLRHVRTEPGLHGPRPEAQPIS
jgi:tRNA uridine 5-carboxymethylaminomethyl modification enzyme